MATFERKDPDGNLNSGESIFNIWDQWGGQTHLTQEEAGQLMRWLRSFLDPLPSLYEKHEREEELKGLSDRGLLITPHSDPNLGWGYTWQGRDWAGPFTTPGAAIHAAFTEALQALQFRSEYSWVLFAQPGERWQFNAGEGWVHIAEEDQPREKRPRVDIEAADAEAQARQDWSNDE